MIPAYDIAIIGGGPAGATLARLLDAKHRVIALDKKTDAVDSFRKPCGGLLAPDAQKALAKFNLTLPKEVLVNPQIFAVKTVDTKQNLQRYYQRFYINLDRHKFDMWLMSLIPKNVEIKRGANCVDIKETDDLYEITYTVNKVEHKITARYVVGADGSNSIVRRHLLPGRTIPRHVSIQQWFVENRQTPLYSCVFDKEITNSYCWSVSKDGHVVLGGAFPNDKSSQRFDLLKRKLMDRGLVLGEPVKTEACLVSMPRGIRDFCVGKSRMFLIGEAAGFISPTSLEGISYALNSARELAEVLNSDSRNPVLKIRIRSIPMRVKLLFKYIKAPFMYSPFLRKIVMKSGVKSIDVAD